MTTAELEAYGFSTSSYVLSDLCTRFQRTKVNGPFSDKTEILAGVPQGSILGPLLFNIFLNDIFLFLTNSNLCNYADDNTLYAINKNLHVCLILRQVLLLCRKSFMRII